MKTKLTKRLNYADLDSLNVTLPKTKGPVEISIEKEPPISNQDTRDMRLLKLKIEDEDWNEAFYKNLKIGI